MGVNITYFVHGTTKDNENGICSGWHQAELSGLGVKQARALRNLLKDRKFDFVFCSDLKRAVDSAALYFDDSYEIIADSRLREINFGDYNGSPESSFKKDHFQHINLPYPNGESYKDVEKRIMDFLRFVIDNHNNSNIAIVAHRAPQLALDVIARDMTWEEAIISDWRIKKEWKPGWEYYIDLIAN